MLQDYASILWLFCGNVPLEGSVSLTHKLMPLRHGTTPPVVFYCVCGQICVLLCLSCQAFKLLIFLFLRERGEGGGEKKRVLRQFMTLFSSSTDTHHLRGSITSIRGPLNFGFTQTRQRVTLYRRWPETILESMDLIVSVDPVGLTKTQHRRSNRSVKI